MDANSSIKTSLTVGNADSQISLKDIQKCHSTYNGSKILFLSRLKVFVRSNVWLNDSKIEELLQRSSNVGQVYKDIIKERLSLQAREDLTPREARALNQMNVRIGRIKGVLTRAIPTMNLKEAEVLGPKEFKEHVLVLGNDYEASQQEEEKRVMGNVKETVQVLQEQVEEHVEETVYKIFGVNIPEVPKVITKLSGAQGLIGSAVSGLVDFAEAHMVASSEGHYIFNELSREDRLSIERLALLDQELKKEGLPEDQREKLKIERQTLFEMAAPLRKKIEEDRVGDVFPVVHTHTLNAVYRHFSGLARALASLKQEHPDFEFYPDNLKGMFISLKIKELQEEIASNTTHAPLFIPPLDNIDLKFMVEVARVRHELVHIQKELGEAEAKLEELIDRGPHPEGWFTAGQSAEDFEAEMAPLKDDVRQCQEAYEKRLEFLQNHQGDLIEMDRRLGALIDQGSKAGEIKFLSKVTNSIIDHVLLPKGIKLGNFREAIIKSQGIEIDEKGREALSEALWLLLDQYGDPAFINRQLEPIIRARLENPPQTPTQKSDFTDGQLINAILGRESAPLDADMTDEYRGLALDILAIGAPEVGSALKTLNQWVGDFGVARQAHEIIESTLQALAMGFGNKQINGALTAAREAVRSESASESAPSLESLRDAIQELASRDTKRAISDLGGGWGGLLIPSSVGEAAADYAVTGAVRLYDITQIKAVNRMLMLGVLSALATSIAEVSR